MDEYGAEISQEGIPLDQASDDQKVLDTRWTTLNIFATSTYSNSLDVPVNGSGLSTQPIIIFTHNLGYIPAFDYIINSYSIGGTSPSWSPGIYADAANIYLDPFISTSITSGFCSLNINITLQVYTLNITNSFQAPTVQVVPPLNASTSEFGIEFINPQYASPEISNNPVSEYNFSTRLKPLNILQCGTVIVPGVGQPNAGYIVINYNYPQNPLYMLAKYYPNGVSNARIQIAGPLLGSLGFQGGRGTITSNTISVTGVQAAFSGSFAYILFKDPIGLTQ